MASIFEKYLETTDRIDPIKCVGHITRVQGLLIESRGPQAILGEICRIELSDVYSPDGKKTVGRGCGFKR